MPFYGPSGCADPAVYMLTPCPDSTEGEGGECLQIHDHHAGSFSRAK